METKGRPSGIEQPSGKATSPENIARGGGSSDRATSGAPDRPAGQSSRSSRRHDSGSDWVWTSETDQEGYGYRPGSRGRENSTPPTQPSKKGQETPRPSSRAPDATTSIPRTRKPDSQASTTSSGSGENSQRGVGMPHSASFRRRGGGRHGGSVHVNGASYDPNKIKRI